MFDSFADKLFSQMKTLKINLLLIGLLSLIAFSFITPPKMLPATFSDCEIDTARIAVVELTVFGMDSLTVTDVQNRLDETCGVSFNFACWADTVVFVEYDSTLTNKNKLMDVIADMGYKPRVKHEY
jgi:hypothetical protein